jgi:hypothetical protein
MGPARHHFLALLLLTLVIAAGSFGAGYLLMLPERSPPAASSMAAAPRPALATAPSPDSAPHLVIKSAFYGDLPDGIAVDVTAKVAAAVSHDKLKIAASNDNFGDPAEGITKKLSVKYTFDGVTYTRTVVENGTLAISGPPRLVIKRAVYGDLPDGPSTDVTEKVAQAADGDSLSLAANNDNFGDPAPGITKKLRVDYTLDGKASSQTVSESETLTIPTGK